MNRIVFAVSVILIGSIVAVAQDKSTDRDVCRPEVRTYPQFS
jgi:hypothetical protein